MSEVLQRDRPTQTKEQKDKYNECEKLFNPETGSLALLKKNEVLKIMAHQIRNPSRDFSGAQWKTFFFFKQQQEVP